MVREGTGKPHHAELLKPTLPDNCYRYYDAFMACSAARVWSQVGPNPISVGEIESFLSMSGIGDPFTKLKYLRLVQRLDRVERAHIQASRKTK